MKSIRVFQNSFRAQSIKRRNVDKLWEWRHILILWRGSTPNDSGEKLFLDYLTLSLSKTSNNPLMWSHYATCHRGVVLGFDSTHRYFTEAIEKSQMLTVEYSETRYVLPQGEEWTLENIRPAFLRKSIDWSYEQEVRVFAAARNATEVLEDSSGIPIYLFGFPKECLREIIFGLYTDGLLRLLTIDLILRAYPQVQIFTTAMNPFNFELDILDYRLRQD
jgi:hypothetical protein